MFRYATQLCRVVPNCGVHDGCHEKGDKPCRTQTYYSTMLIN